MNNGVFQSDCSDFYAFDFLLPLIVKPSKKILYSLQVIIPVLNTSFFRVNFCIFYSCIQKRKDLLFLFYKENQ